MILFLDSLFILDKENNKYKTIEGYEVDKYAYSYHTVSKLKTIKSLQELEED